MTTLALLENRRLEEQARLDGDRDAAERNRTGQFATPPALALEIARYARQQWQRRKDRVRFLDPALGTGAFYSALRQVFPPARIASATGVEVDPSFARVASALWGGAGLQVIEADFTRTQPPPAEERFNFILTNPPYVRHHHLTPEQKRRLQRLVMRDLGIRVSGLAGLYCYFVLLADRWLADGGLAAWLVPSEFMDVNYGQAVKRYLTRCELAAHPPLLPRRRAVCGRPRVVRGRRLCQGASIPGSHRAVHARRHSPAA
jgi:type I restriction-modification system DNA methylase subunit